MDRQSVHSMQDYLEAKRRVDLRCLNRYVLGAFRKLIEAVRDPALLDLGTGTGLMIRKLAAMRLNGNARIIGVDLDEGSCLAAVGFIKHDLAHFGYQSTTENRSQAETGLCGRIQAQREECCLHIEVKAGDVLAAGTPWRPHGLQFDAVTANAFVDLLPLKDIVALVRRLLKPGGLFYTTINYDGMTTLLPLSTDVDFEEELLLCYNRSMELRRAGGRATGGSRTGSRLYGVLLEQGFGILGWGSSDWSVVPKQGRYGPGEANFIRAILQMIHDEGWNSGKLPQRKLERWLSERLEALERGGLSFMNHQIDALAQKE